MFSKGILFRALLVCALGGFALSEPPKASASGSGGEQNCFVCDPNVGLVCPSGAYMDEACGTLCGPGRTHIPGTCQFPSSRCGGVKQEWQCSN